MSGGAFAEWQPRYAEVGIVTFPVRGKVPAIRNYLRLKASGSRSLVARFADAPALGLAPKPSGIVVVDVDTPSEAVLADALARYGETPFIVRSGGGNYQAWYRRTDEGRCIRPDPNLPIDILGDGFVVAPPSLGEKRQYEILQGSLADLRSLPTLGNRSSASGGEDHTVRPTQAPEVGHRNTTLWHHCMAEAHSCADFDSLLDVARTRNRQFKLPLDDVEVEKTARSAWGYTDRGQNLVGRQHVRIAYAAIDQLLAINADSFILHTLLLRYNADRTVFPVANAMAKAMPSGGWTLKRFRMARSCLLELGFIVQVRAASSYNGAALYKWGSRR